MPWLPQPKEWRDLTVAAEPARADSMLRLYQDALRIRRAEDALGDAPMALAAVTRRGARLHRGSSFRCVTNHWAEPVPLPLHAAALLASGPLDTGLLPPDTTVWLRIQ